MVGTVDEYDLAALMVNHLYDCARLEQQQRCIELRIKVRRAFNVARFLSANGDECVELNQRNNPNRRGWRPSFDMGLDR